MTKRPSGNTPTDSLAPVELDRITIEEEAAFMNRGKGKSLFGIGAVLIAAVAGGATLLSSMETHQAYANAADGVRELSAESFDGFWNCALPDAFKGRVASGEQLHTALEMAGERFGQAYAQQLRRCSSKLEPLTSLTLSVPADLGAEKAAFASAGSSLGTAVESYATKIEGQPRYDYVALSPAIDKVANAWDGFVAARESLLSAATR